MRFTHHSYADSAATYGARQPPRACPRHETMMSSKCRTLSLVLATADVDDHARKLPESCTSPLLEVLPCEHGTSTALRPCQLLIDHALRSHYR